MNQKKSWYADYVHQVENPFAGVPPEVIELLRKELAEGEEILWFEQPRAGSLWRSGRSFSGYLAVGVNIFNIFMNLIFLPLQSGRQGSFWWIWLLGLVFWIVVIGMSPILWMQTARKTLYVLTAQRAIIVNGKSVKSYYLHQQIHSRVIKAKARKNGSGDLIFAKETVGRESQTTIKFFGIRQVNEIKQLLDELLAERLEDAVTTLPLRLQPAVKATLKDGEKVLWAAQPDAYWLKADEGAGTGGWQVLGCFGFVAWTVAFIVALVPVLTGFSAGNYQIGFFIGLGVLIALVVGGIYLVKRLSGKMDEVSKITYETAYLLTNQRIIRVTKLSNQEEKIESFYFSTLSRRERVTVVKHKDNTGNIYLTPDSKSLITTGPDVKLIGIWEPDKVERLIRQQLASY